MTRAYTGISFAALLSTTVFGQSTATAPTFEVADVHESARATNPYTYNSGGVLRGERYDLRKATMLDLIATAWNVDPDTIVGGPNWLELDRFDIAAKAPSDTRMDTIRLMLQVLLEDRFRLVVHKETRPQPAYLLTAREASAPKIRASESNDTSGCTGQPQPPPFLFQVYFCRSISMSTFAQTLRGMAGDYLTVPVIDSTSLEGKWDFDVKWNPRARIPQPGTDRITIFDAVEKQLGLSLELKTAPAPVLVVDRVDKTPAPNPPGTDKLLPARVVEFEVADLKLSRPDETGFGSVDPGRLQMHNVDLPGLIGYGFDMDFDHVRDLVSGLPKSAESTRVDINAKLPFETIGSARASYADDDLRLMTRNLLIERFGIKFHYEERLVPAYSLVSAKSKLRKADLSHRSSCKEGRVVANDPRDANPRLNRLVICRNVTMAQFAAQLLGIAPGYLATSVEDATGIEGTWDFTLSFSNPGLMIAPAADGASPSDPNGAISLFDALNRQLGLKLEKRRRMVPILVIDHMEQKPTDN